jgi:protein-disulfide isomerase
MKYKYIIFAVFLLLPAMAYAQEPESTEDGSQTTPDAAEGGTATWEWPDLGLTFDYPAQWERGQQEGFNFVLFQPVAEGEPPTNFLGVQSGYLTAEEDVATLFDSFESTYGGEAQPITLGDTEGLRLDVTAQNGTLLTFLGYQVSGDLMAVMVLNGLDDEAFPTVRDAVIETIVAKPVSMDVESLSADMQASLEADGTLKVGDPDAPIKIVEMMDFSCPHCMEYATTMERLVNDYVQTGQVQFELVLLTFVGEDFSITAANAQYCAAAQGKGWEAHERLFEMNRNIGAQSFTTPSIEDEFADLGLDAEAFSTCMDERPYNDLLEGNQQRFDEIEASGTPTLLVGSGDEAPGFVPDENGEPLRGGVTLRFLYPYLEDLLAS